MGDYSPTKFNKDKRFNNMPKINILLRLGLITAILFLSGCATTSQSDDPLESYNRAMYSFNDTLDRAIIKPVAQGYDAVMPDPISQGITNFFSNLNEITVIFNDLLQFKFSQAAHDTGRFLLNSTVGFAGIFDVAGYAGHEKNNEDFGQTLAVWGVNSGPYIVVPLLGSTTFRDGAGWFVDFNITDPVAYVDHVPTRNQLYGTKLINTRANLLGIKKVIGKAAIDEYAYVRDAHLQRRQNLIYDGNPPEDDDFDVFSDE